MLQAAVTYSQDNLREQALVYIERNTAVSAWAYAWYCISLTFCSVLCVSTAWCFLMMLTPLFNFLSKWCTKTLIFVWSILNFPTHKWSFIFQVTVAILWTFRHVCKIFYEAYFDKISLCRLGKLYFISSHETGQSYQCIKFISKMKVKMSINYTERLWN